MVDRWQYQARAEPVLVPAPFLPLDWLPETNRPRNPDPPRDTALSASGEATAGYPLVVDYDWWVPASVPRAPDPSPHSALAASGETLIPGGLPPTPLAWASPTTLVWPELVVLYQAKTPIPEPLLLDMDWLVQASEPVRPLFRPYYYPERETGPVAPVRRRRQFDVVLRGFRRRPKEL